MIAGPLLVIAYNAELIVHTDTGFAAAWGAFPVLTGYVAQTGRIAAAPMLAAAAAHALSLAMSWAIALLAAGLAVACLT